MAIGGRQRMTNHLGIRIKSLTTANCVVSSAMLMCNDVAVEQQEQLEE